VRVTVDLEACTGHGRCYALGPDVFETDDYGHCVLVVTGDVPTELEEQARLGRDNCPEQAISIEE
jgi:ferredoxin